WRTRFARSFSGIAPAKRATAGPTTSRGSPTMPPPWTRSMGLPRSISTREGGARVLREPHEDGGHSEARGGSAVVREPHALGSAILQRERPGRHREHH